MSSSHFLTFTWQKCKRHLYSPMYYLEINFLLIVFWELYCLTRSLIHHQATKPLFYHMINGIPMAVDNNTSGACIFSPSWSTLFYYWQKLFNLCSKRWFSFWTRKIVHSYMWAAVLKGEVDFRSGSNKQASSAIVCQKILLFGKHVILEQINVALNLIVV